MSTELSDHYIKEKNYNEIQKNKIKEYIRFRNLFDEIIFIMKDHNEHYLERLFNIGNNYIRKILMQLIINNNTFCLTSDDETFLFDELKIRMEYITEPPTADDLNDRLGLYVDLFLRIYNDYEFQYNIEEEYIQYKLRNLSLKSCVDAAWPSNIWSVI